MNTLESRPRHTEVLSLVKRVKALEEAGARFAALLCTSPAVGSVNELDEFDLTDTNRHVAHVTTPLGRLRLVFDMSMNHQVPVFEVTVFSLESSGDPLNILTIDLKSEMSVSLKPGSWFSLSPDPKDKDSWLEWRSLRVAILEAQVEQIRKS